MREWPRAFAGSDFPPFLSSLFSLDSNRMYASSFKSSVPPPSSFTPLSLSFSAPISPLLLIFYPLLAPPLLQLYTHTATNFARATTLFLLHFVFTGLASSLSKPNLLPPSPSSFTLQDSRMSKPPENDVPPPAPLQQQKTPPQLITFDHHLNTFDHQLNSFDYRGEEERGREGGGVMKGGERRDI
jgi:hypothetical protein